MESPKLKRYYSIGEVSQLAEVEQYVLRYWESEFPSLRPRRSRAGKRTYTAKDIEVVLLIKRLLYEERYTIEGAKNYLKKLRRPSSPQLDLDLEETKARNVLLEVRQGLKELVEWLEAGTSPEVFD